MHAQISVLCVCTYSSDAKPISCMSLQRALSRTLLPKTQFEVAIMSGDGSPSVVVLCQVWQRLNCRTSCSHLPLRLVLLALVLCVLAVDEISRDEQRSGGELAQQHAREQAEVPLPVPVRALLRRHGRVLAQMEVRQVQEPLGRRGELRDKRGGLQRGTCGLAPSFQSWAETMLTENLQALRPFCMPRLIDCRTQRLAKTHH